jgi:hypothetical protein
MTLRILVENYEVFAKLNYLRDLMMDTELGSWEEEKDLYLEEAASTQVQRGYVLTNQELDLILNSTRNC